MSRTKPRLNLSADLGEGGPEDSEILRFVDSASVGCGVHAGSAGATIATARLCRELGVQVGAHPGYDDRDGFGRRETGLAVPEIEVLVGFQVAALAAVAAVAYLKPHGALYHRCQMDRQAAEAVVRVAKAHGAGVLAAPGGELLAAAARAGLGAFREGFVDRRLLEGGRLAPRDSPDALLSAEEAASQAVRLAASGEFDSLCLHGDTPGAAAIAATVRAALKEAGVATGPLGAT